MLLEVVNVIVLIFMITIAITPVGSLINRIDTFNKNNFYEYYDYFSSTLIYSLIVLSFLALSINFLLPLNKDINNFVLFISLIILILLKKKYFNKEFLIFSFLISLITTLIILKTHTFRPDAGLYHLPYIGILNNEKIIFGLTNIHYRYGFISIIQYTSAILNNILMGTNGIILPSALIFSTIVINFSNHLIYLIKNKNYNFHLFFLCYSLIFILIKMSRYSEFGNDSPAHLLFLFLISQMLKDLNSYSSAEIKNFFILSIFIVLNKIFLIVAIFYPFIFLKKQNTKKIFFNGKAIFGLCFVSFWLLKNIIISGCAVYPIKSTCLNNIEWSNNKAEIVADESEAWAKSWINYSKKINHKDYLKEFFWFKTWILNNGYKTFKIIFPYLIILVIITILIRSKQNEHTVNFAQDELKKIRKILLFSLLGICFWFLKAPDYRFGAGYIISSISLFFSYILIRKKFKKNIKKILITILYLSFLFFILKNSQRILFTSNDYNNFPWPKYYSHDDKNERLKYQIIRIGNKTIYKSNSYCMYGLSPCTSIKFDILVKEKFKYIFFIKKN